MRHKDILALLKKWCELLSLDGSNTKSQVKKEMQSVVEKIKQDIDIETELE